MQSRLTDCDPCSACICGNLVSCDHSVCNHIDHVDTQNRWIIVENPEKGNQCVWFQYVFGSNIDFSS